MVIIRMVGGLASQLHKYAIGRTLADQHSCELMLDLSWFSAPAEGDTPRKFLLDNYRARYSIATPVQIERLRSSQLRLRWTSLSARLGQPVSFLKKTHYVRGFAEKDVLDCTPPVYIEGEWFGGRFLERDEKNLRQDFRLQLPLQEGFAPLLQQMRAANSVAVHVRRGDFVHSTLASSLHNVLGLAYYAEALGMLRSRLGQPHFFVFSDDYQWASNNLNVLGDDLTFVQENEPFEDLFLMSSCDHQIIANSGFSWFAAWLNENPDKILVAPGRWVKDERLNAEIVADLASHGFEIVDGNK